MGTGANDGQAVPLHPLAQRYLNRLNGDGKNPGSRECKSIQADVPERIPTSAEWKAQQDVIAALLGCHLDDTCAVHSRDTFTTLFTEAADDPPPSPPPTAVAAAPPPAIDQSIDLGRPRCILARPTVRETVDAVSRYLLSRKASFPNPLHKPNTRYNITTTTTAVAAPLFDNVASNPYLHLNRTYTAIMSSVLRLSVKHASYVDTTTAPAAAAQATSVRVYAMPTRPGAGEMPTPPVDGAWDELAAARHAVGVLAHPGLRAQLQQLVWPTATALHKAILKRVDGLFLVSAKPGEAGRKGERVHTERGWSWLRSAGMASVDDLKVALFSLDKRLFSVAHKDDSLDHLAPYQRAQVRKSANAYEVFVRSMGAYAAAGEAPSAALANALGRPRAAVMTRHMTAPLPGSSTSNSSDGRSSSNTVTPCGGAAASGDDLSVSDGLWLLLGEMGQLRLLVSSLLAGELALHGIKALAATAEPGATSSHTQQHQRQQQQQLDAETLRAAGALVELASHHTAYLTRRHLSSLPSRTMLSVSRRPATKAGHEERGKETMDAGGGLHRRGGTSCSGSGSASPPERYASVVQLYNAFADTLRRQKDDGKREEHPALVAAKSSETAKLWKDFSFPCIVQNVHGRTPDHVVAKRLTLSRPSTDTPWPFRISVSTERMGTGFLLQLSPHKGAMETLSTAVSAGSNTAVGAEPVDKGLRKCSELLRGFSVLCALNGQPVSTGRSPTAALRSSLKLELVLRAARRR